MLFVWETIKLRVLAMENKNVGFIQVKMSENFILNIFIRELSL